MTSRTGCTKKLVAFHPSGRLAVRVGRGIDPFGIRARSTPGRETLVIIVTAENQFLMALGHLLALHPELDIRAEPIRIGNWGAAVVSYDVE